MTENREHVSSAQSQSLPSRTRHAAVTQPSFRRERAPSLPSGRCASMAFRSSSPHDVQHQNRHGRVGNSFLRRAELSLGRKHARALSTCVQRGRDQFDLPPLASRRHVPPMGDHRPRRLRILRQGSENDHARGAARACADAVALFHDEISNLGSTLGPLLLQLPPSLPFDPGVLEPLYRSLSQFGPVSNCLRAATCELVQRRSRPMAGGTTNRACCIGSGTTSRRGDPGRVARAHLLSTARLTANLLLLVRFRGACEARGAHGLGLRRIRSGASSTTRRRAPRPRTRDSSVPVLPRRCSRTALARD